MSAFEIAKRAGSTGAASGGSISRRVSAEFLPLKAQRRLQARLEKPLALRWVEGRRPSPKSYLSETDWYA